MRLKLKASTYATMYAMFEGVQGREPKGEEKGLTVTIYRDISYMGFFVGGEVEPYERPAWVDGCQWFRSCLQCRWHDCVTESLSRYESESSAEKRRKLMSRLLRQGFKAEHVAEFFYMPVEEVKGLDSVTPIQAACKNAEQRARMRLDVIELRRGGMSETTVSLATGLSKRQVRRLCEGVIGIKRGRYHSKYSPPVIAVSVVAPVVDVDDQYTRDLQVHIRRTNSASSWSAADKTAGNVGCLV